MWHGNIFRTLHMAPKLCRTEKHIEGAELQNEILEILMSWANCGGFDMTWSYIDWLIAIFQIVGEIWTWVQSDDISFLGQYSCSTYYTTFPTSLCVSQYKMWHWLGPSFQRLRTEFAKCNWPSVLWLFCQSITNVHEMKALSALLCIIFMHYSLALVGKKYKRIMIDSSTWSSMQLRSHSDSEAKGYVFRFEPQHTISTIVRHF